MSHLPFTKYEGAGNDFIVMWKEQCKGISPLQLARLCSRRFMVGADGLVLVSPHEKSYQIQVHNADGSPAALCGNGLRCAFQFLLDEGEKRQVMPLLTGGGWVQLEKQGKNIQAEMPLPSKIQKLTIEIDGHNCPLTLVHNVIPHVVLFADEMPLISFEVLAPKIRHHPHFSPYGTTVNMATPQEAGFSIRTFEVGVEAETWGCGTGAMATAVAASQSQAELAQLIPIHTRSGVTLTIGIQKSNNVINTLSMAGPARRVFEGRCDLAHFSENLT